MGPLTVPQTIVLRAAGGAEHTVEIARGGAPMVGGQEFAVNWIRPGEARSGDRTLWIARDGAVCWVFLDGRVHVFEAQRRDTPVRRKADHAGSLSAPMPATVIAIRVSPGDPVKAGDTLIVLEAMKMELPVRAPADGTVGAVRCREGELVQPGQDLIDVIPAGDVPATGKESP